MVDFVDLTRRYATHADAFAAAAQRVLASGAVLNGAETAELELELANRFGRRHAIAVSSGAAAIELALAALGVGPGDEVLVPAFTAVPTASAVCAVGARPVLVDVDPVTATIDPAAAEAALTVRTRAIVPVHLYGYPVDLGPITALGVPVVDDAAQAHGALDGSVQTAATAYSFYPTKNVGGIGDGGAVLTDDDELAAAVRRRRVHGMTEQYVHVDISQNHRVSELEAAWLRLQLPQLEAANARRREVAERYRTAAPTLRWHAAHARHARHLCVARVDDRDAFRSALAARGVATAVHYPLALTQQPAYGHLATTPCPEAEAWAAQCVSLPCYPELRDDEVDLVAAALAEVTE